MGEGWWGKEESGDLVWEDKNSSHTVVPVYMSWFRRLVFGSLSHRDCDAASRFQTQRLLAIACDLSSVKRDKTRGAI
jgi:hypothetical protein